MLNVSRNESRFGADRRSGGGSCYTRQVTDDLTISADHVVTLRYVLTDSSGKELDKSGDDPLEYLHGHHNIVPGLEEALAGKKVGDQLQVVVPPDKGYGRGSGRKPQRIPRSEFPKEADLKVGMQFGTRSPDGQMVPIWITKLQGPTVVVSMDHPLSGVELHFDVTIETVRAATEEELSHGHGHGHGGHGHGH